MKIGYFQDFNLNLIKEIEFAKKNFDFIEITFNKGFNLLKKDINTLKKLLVNFPIIVHIHWELNFNKKEDYKEIIKSINIASKIGAKKIIIHPIKELDIDKNIFNLNKIKDYCKTKNMELLLENMIKPFGKYKIIKNILDKTKLHLALDIGHANRLSKNELEKFIKLNNKIKHIHLHENIKEKDHLFFENREKLKNILKKIKLLDKDLTISLEMFETNKYKIISYEKRKILLIKQRNLIKSILN